MTTGQNRRVIILENAQALAAAAAERVLARIAQSRDRAAIALTGGSTPQRLYRLLATERYRAKLPLDRVHWFMGDDRFVPLDDPRSNLGMARRTLLGPIGAPEANIHPAMPLPFSLEEAARSYEDELKDFYGADQPEPARPLFDLVLLGLGEDGHTASLFPSAPALDARERWVMGVSKAAQEPFVPRITLTLPVLGSTREMLFLVSGSDKRAILARVLAGEDLPATRAYSAGELIWLVDRDAAPAT